MLRAVRGVQALLDHDGKDVETTFGAVFQLSYEAYGAVRTVDLVPGGGQVAVTAANRREYVRLYVQHTLVTSVAPQYEAFARGFTKVPSPTHHASLSFDPSLSLSVAPLHPSPRLTSPSMRAFVGRPLLPLLPSRRSAAATPSTSSSPRSWSCSSAATLSWTSTTSRPAPRTRTATRRARHRSGACGPCCTAWPSPTNACS